MASHLLKWVHFQQDTLGEDLELCYFRDVDGREVDLVIVSRKKPLLFIECTWSDAELSPALKYLKQRFPDCQAFQISAIGKKDFIDNLGIRVCPAVIFLKILI